MGVGVPSVVWIQPMKKTVLPGNGSGNPFCQKALRRQNDESQNVMLKV